MVPKWCPDVKNSFVKRKTVKYQDIKKALIYKAFNRWVVRSYAEI